MFKKIQKMYKEASNQKVVENRPPKIEHSDYNYDLEIKKQQKINSKKPPKVKKNQKNV